MKYNNNSPRKALGLRLFRLTRTNHMLHVCNSHEDNAELTKSCEIDMVVDLWRNIDSSRNIHDDVASLDGILPNLGSDILT
eukprot:scaffold18707_cov80-Skeletonema_dohrnii-CCMP3373.AAC.1